MKEYSGSDKVEANRNFEAKSEETKLDEIKKKGTNRFVGKTNV